MFMCGTALNEDDGTEVHFELNTPIGIFLYLVILYRRDRLLGGRRCQATHVFHCLRILASEALKSLTAAGLEPAIS